MDHVRLLIAAIVAAASPWATGQTVYRCGSNYSQQPCAGGSAIETPPAPSAADRAQSASVAAADAKRADALQKARLEQEKNAPRAVVPAASPGPPVADPAKGGPKAKAGKLEQFTAVSPGKPGKKKAKKKPKAA
jgi:hypothetical protein